VNDAPRPSAARAALGWALAAAALAWTVLVYYGFGPYPTQVHAPWWHPRGFLGDSAVLAPFGGRTDLAIAALAAPALALALGAFAASRSALVRLLALAAPLASGVFLFYGLRYPGPQIWRFFGWRGSAVMLAMALLTAAALLAPLLAASWLRRGWALRGALYLPLAALVAASAASITGTDPELPFAVSPWPVLTVFGYDLVATLLAGLLACLGLALAAWRLRARRPPLSVSGIAGALAIPALWLGLELPSGLWLLGGALAVAGLALRLVAVAAGNLTMGLRSSAGYTALAALLLAGPLLVGRAWARIDYQLTREARAQTIIDALAAYYEREGLYPEALGELVEAGVLERVPKPQIGLAALAGAQFGYQNFGTDYLLEFASPGWTQCAFSPPWQNEFEGENFLEPSEPPDDAPSDAGLGPPEEEEPVALPGAWTCPSKPPELW